MARLLYGRPLAEEIHASLIGEVAELRAQGRVPRLAALSLAPGAAARVYVERLRKRGASLGIEVVDHEASEEVDLYETIERSNQDPAISGIILMTPLPTEIDEISTIERLLPSKDVEGVHPYNAGRVALGVPRFVPSTAEAVMTLLKSSEMPLAGARAVVIGRSAVIGQPVAFLLVRENATVTVAHRATKDVAALTREAEVVVVAVGKPGVLTADMVRPGAVIADAGINVTPDGVIGDVAFDEVAALASAITPVPGGVGALTTLLLLRNVVRAAQAQR